MASTTNPLVSLDYLAWSKAPGIQRHLSSNIFQGFRGYVLGTVQGPDLSLAVAWFECPLESTPYGTLTQ